MVFKLVFEIQAAEKRMPEWEELAATAAAVQNMHLMATSLGAAGYWTSWCAPASSHSSAAFPHSLPFPD